MSPMACSSLSKRRTFKAIKVSNDNYTVYLIETIIILCANQVLHTKQSVDLVHTCICTIVHMHSNNMFFFNAPISTLAFRHLPSANNMEFHSG